jgi:hypothetical protein
MLGEVANEFDIKQIEIEYADAVEELVHSLSKDDIRVQQAIADSFAVWKTGPIADRRKTYYAIIKAKTDVIRDINASKKNGAAI